MTKILTSIVVIGFLLRLAVVFFLPDQGFPDAGEYTRAGMDLFTTGIIRNNYAMPLYPIWAHLWGGGVWLKIADALLSAATIWLIAQLSLSIFHNNAAAVLAALAAAIYPHFLFYAASGLTETSYLFLLVLAFWLMHRGRMHLGSLVLAVSLLMRPSLELVAPLLVLAFSMVVHREGIAAGLRRVGIYLAIYLSLMAPWWIHNYAKYDQFVRLSLGDGVVLYAGNNPLNKTGGGIINRPGGGDDVDFSAFQHIADPIERNAALRNAAIAYIADNPGHFVEMTGIKFVRFWRLWPHAEQYTGWHIIAASLLSYGVMLAASLGFLIQHGCRHWRAITPMILTAGYLTAIHMVTIGSIRYRFPLEGFIIILGCYWIMGLPTVQRIAALRIPSK